MTINQFFEKNEKFFEGREEKVYYSGLGYMIDLNFHGNKFAKKIDENGHRDRNINHE